MLKHIFRRKLLNVTNLSKVNINFVRCASSLKNEPNYNQVFSIYENRVKIRERTVMHETNYIYNIINPNYHNSQLIEQDIITEEQFKSLLNQNWRKRSASEICKTFQILQPYCTKNDIDISDVRFDFLVDGLMDHCEKLTIAELYDLLHCLRKFPRCNSFLAHNFHDVWSCLDDICLWHAGKMQVEQLFSFCDLWFEMGLARTCDFIYQTVDRLTKRADSLSPHQLVRIFFYYNAMRSAPVAFEYQHALQYHLNNLTIDELATIALGFFKSQSKVKLLTILEAMIRSVIDNSKTVHEISLTAILKIIGYTTNSGCLVNEVHAMLDSIYPEMDRLSPTCILHIALVGTTLQKYHRDTLAKAAEILVKDFNDPKKIRMKDIERILLSLTIFDFDPKTKPDIFQAALEALHNENRSVEFEKFPRCVCAALYYLSLRSIFSYELLNKVLNVSFINEKYGKEIKYFPREIMFLDNTVEIECKDYKGKRVPLHLKQRAVKWMIDYPPSQEQYKKLTHSDKIFLDVRDQVKKVVKEDKYFTIDHVLPHFATADIIVCKNKKTHAFVEPTGLDKYVLGQVKYAPESNDLEWFAVVVVGWNHTVRDSSLLFGSIIVKEKQLQKIGYKPILVIWNQFMHLKDADKYRYLFHKMRLPKLS